jgi:putative transposase
MYNFCMDLMTRTVILPLEPHPAFGETLIEAHRAYRIISKAAFETQTKSRYALQKLVYEDVRAATKLTAQMTCSTIRKVAAAYKAASMGGYRLDEPDRFSGNAIDLEGSARGRDFRLYPERGIVSISTVDGRKKRPYRCGRFQRGYLESLDWKVQAAKLMYKRRKKGWRFELHVQVIRESPEPKTGSILGVDTGRRYLAVATTGEDANFFEAEHLKPRKEQFRRLRGQLKAKGTRSSARTFVRVSGREARLYQRLPAPDGEGPGAACS